MPYGENAYSVECENYQAYNGSINVANIATSVNIQLEHLFSLVEVRVVDSFGPVRNVLINMEYAPNRDLHYSTNANAEGIARFPRLPYSQYNCSLDWDGWPRVVQQIVINQPQMAPDFDIGIARGDVQINARVEDGTNQQYPITVVMNGQTQYCQQGYVIFRAVPFENQSCTLSFFDCPSKTIQVNVNQRLVLESAFLERSMSDVTFHVVNAQGQPIVGRSISYSGQSRNPVLAAITDQQGVATLRNVPCCSIGNGDGFCFMVPGSGSATYKYFKIDAPQKSIEVVLED